MRTALDQDVGRAEDAQPALPDKNTTSLKAGDYTIGLVCALPVELAATLHVLDAEHDQVQLDVADDNQYFYGKIGLHHVVLACLPKGQIGNNMASAVASQLRAHFPSMRFALMIGIGGGVPSEDVDIRLGDVVISTPQAQYPGVVQYDLGKTGVGGHFKRTGSLAPPPSALLKVVSKLEAKQLRGRSDLAKYLESFDQLNDSGFAYPGAAKDTLYVPEYSHTPAGAKTCNQCDKACSVERTPRRNKTPHVHFGLIASGNQVIKDAVTRDQTSQALDGVLCFEMEAAGLMSTFPCLVVRGIADYTDSHKSKAFQPWAAAAAAACAKEILYELAPADVARTKSLEEILEVTRGISTQIRQITKRQDTEDRQRLNNWLSDFDEIAEHNDLWLKHKEGTSAWLLDHPQFTAWRDGPGSTLFCPGNPGAGKTMIVSAVVDHLQRDVMAQDVVGFCYVYCNYTKQSKQDMAWFLSSMLKQLIRGVSDLPEHINVLFQERSRKGTRLNVAELFSLTAETMKRFSRNYIVIDGLDECTNEGGLRKAFLDTLIRLQMQSGAHIFATSRYITEICDVFSDGHWIPISAVVEDICIYLQSRVHELPHCVISSQSLQSEIQWAIVAAADGIFLLADLHLNSLTNKFTVRAVRDALKALSKGFDGLEAAYRSAIVRIDSQTMESRTLAKQVISWMTYSMEPLTIFELQHALAVVEGDEDLDQSNIVRAEDVIRVCEGFVTIDRERALVRFVHYTVQEFFERVRGEWLPDGHEMITNTCLTYLTSAGIASACTTRQDFIAQRQLYPFLAYAGYQWGRHARLTSLEQCGALEKILDNPNRFSGILTMLLRINVGRWLRATSVDEEIANEMWASSQQLPWNDFHLASWFGLEELASQLLQQSASLADVKDDLGRTPLTVAIDRGHSGVSNALIASSHISLSSVDGTGQTPMHNAVLTSQLESMKLMLGRSDCDINAKDDSGDTPLILAARWRREHAMLCLLINTLVVGGLNINAQNRESKTALWYAADQNLVMSFDPLLHSAGQDANLQDSEGVSALAQAASNGHVSIVIKLLDSGKVDVNLSDNVGDTALAKAATNGHQDVVNMLLGSRDTDVNAMNSRLQTALILATISGQERIVSLLLGAESIDVNCMDLDGYTALMRASQFGFSSIAGLLMNYAGLDMFLKDKAGRTAASIAAEQGHKDIADRLRALEV